jgi:hypothetical protein
MPLKDLPEYIKSVRENGQTDDIPVVDMGRIVADPPMRPRFFTYAAAACLLLTVGGMMTYGAAASKSITIVAADVDAGAIAAMVKEGGASVVSVEQDEDRTYKVRVLTLRMNSLLDNLRRNRNLERVDADE